MAGMKKISLRKDGGLAKGFLGKDRVFRPAKTEEKEDHLEELFALFRKKSMRTSNHHDEMSRALAEKLEKDSYEICSPFRTNVIDKIRKMTGREADLLFCIAIEFSSIDSKSGRSSLLLAKDLLFVGAASIGAMSDSAYILQTTIRQEPSKITGELLSHICTRIRDDEPEFVEGIVHDMEHLERNGNEDQKLAASSFRKSWENASVVLDGE
jgi:hypothetical protein